MKKTSVIIGIVILVVLLVVGAWIGRAYYIANYGDEYMEWAKQNHPLGGRHTYIITPNVEMTSSNDGSIIPEGTYYTFYPTGAGGENPVDRQKIWGRYVSDKTTIDLTPYIGQPVHMWGKFEHGNTKLLREATNSAGLQGTEVLIIEKIELAE